MDASCGDIEVGLEESQGPEDGEESQQEMDDKESLTQVAARKPRTQKVSSRIAVQAARGLPRHQEEVDGADSEDQHRSQKWKEPSHGQVSAKDDWAGVGDWADKLASSQCSTSNSRHTRLVSGSSLSSLITGCNVTPASISTHTSTPQFLPSPEPQDHNSYIHGNDDAERNAMSESNPTAKPAATRQTGSMGIAEIVSSSELDEFSPAPPPTPSCIPYKKRSTRRPTSQQAPRSKGKPSMKRAQSDQPDDDSDGTSVAAPPSKRAKTAPRSISGPQRSGSGVNNKYIKDDLPHGCTNDNVWRRLFLSALAHFMAGYDDPWTIPSEKFRLVLQVIWDTVYGGDIEHVVTLNGPVYQIAKQSVNNWRGGFAAAAVSIVATFFTHDPDFGDAMLKKNRFLYDQNRGVDSKVCRILTLVAENKVVFQPSRPGNVWTTVIPKGNQYEFNDTVWGATTRRYLDPIKNLSHEHFTLVIEETQRFVKKPVSNLNAGDSGDDDSGYDELFAFR
ncbi:hypothetical protein PAXINDRAFT_158173 [Paxillus involutus ATCC 200175]|uniref:Uncharacterized protein n=1 Tax=Paxillus involutus ATCC 200175 TaxID=664439 RepID=A0A0C9SNQ3_PAXIN|nr:hypothetical protein PAXINDRAFT_158173 [Paxillus involutus ATCC 200175]